jgi:hypothetical protein
MLAIGPDASLDAATARLTAIATFLATLAVAAGPGTAAALRPFHPSGGHSTGDSQVQDWIIRKARTALSWEAPSAIVPTMAAFVQGMGTGI